MQHNMKTVAPSPNLGDNGILWGLCLLPTRDGDKCLRIYHPRTAVLSDHALLRFRIQSSAMQ